MDDQEQRILGAVRQSRTKTRVKGEKVVPVSPTAQRKQIGRWADANGGTVVKFTFDLSTSGGTSAFRRKGLGPWLTEPGKIDAWDVLVLTKLDRGCRDVADYLKLRTWCEKRGKRLVVLNNPNLDNTTPQGRAMGTLTATFAELEREMSKERNKERYDYLIEIGRWPGGRLPYGKRYNSETGKLEPDKGGSLEILFTMADISIAGKSDGQIAKWLNSHGHLTVVGGQWNQQSVRYVLRSESTQQLLGKTKADELRAALRSREQTRGERVNRHMLLRVAYCRQCNGPLYCVVRDRPSGGYYRCLPCGRYLRKDKLEERTENSLLFLYGNLDLVEYQLVPGDDHQAIIHALERDIEALEKITGTEMVISAKRAEIDHLEALPFDPDHYEPVPQGISVAQHWETLDNEGKGSFLRKRRVRVFADKEGFEFHGGLLETSKEMPGILEPVR